MCAQLEYMHAHGQTVVDTVFCVIQMFHNRKLRGQKVRWLSRVVRIHIFGKKGKQDLMALYVVIERVTQKIHLLSVCFLIRKKPQNLDHSLHNVIQEQT